MRDDNSEWQARAYGNLLFVVLSVILASALLGFIFGMFGCGGSAKQAERPRLRVFINKVVQCVLSAAQEASELETPDAGVSDAI